MGSDCQWNVAALVLLIIIALATFKNGRRD